MGGILATRIAIDPAYLTERDFYQTAVVDRLELTDDQWAVVWPIIEEELKFPKINYMVYPLFYRKNLTAKELIAYEEDNYSFLSYQARARLQMDPGPCTYSEPTRTYIGLYPDDPYTRSLETQLKLWTYQFQQEYGYYQPLNALFFQSEQQMLDYVAHPDYESDPDRPGLCAGVSHYEDKNGGHRFKYHFTD